MKLIEKHPMIMIVVGVLGISLSSIFVKFSQAPSAVTAAWRLLWTVLMLTPVVLGKAGVRRELVGAPKKLVWLSIFSGLFLAIHFVLWFESLQHTSVASSTTIVCTEVIWVCLGFCLFLKGRISGKAMLAIGVTLLGSVLITLSDSGSGAGLYGDILALLAALGLGIFALCGGFIKRADFPNSLTEENVSVFIDVVMHSDEKAHAAQFGMFLSRKNICKIKRRIHNEEKHVETYQRYCYGSCYARICCSMRR